MEARHPSRNPARPGPRPSTGPWVAAVFTLGCVALAFHVRSLNTAGVFDGEPLYLSGIDAYGYMRRAWLALGRGSPSSTPRSGSPVDSRSSPTSASTSSLP